MFNRETSIFVAGHKGMVGSSILRLLKKKNFENIFTVSRSELDLTNKIQVENWFSKKKPEIVILAAAKVGGISLNSRYPTQFLIENIEIQNNIIINSWKNKTKRLLFLGSSCIYPKYANQPIKEEELLSGYLEPTNESYALAKIVGIRLCNALRDQYNFDAISLMPTNLYGPGDNYHPEDGHVLAALIRKFCEAKDNDKKQVTCWGTGNVYREFLHVDDLSEACLYVLENWYPNNSDLTSLKDGKKLTHLNVGTGIDLTIKDLSEMIAKIVNYEGFINWDKTKPDGTPRKNLDISRIKKIGWFPKISLEDGLIQSIKEFRSMKYL